MSNKLPAALVLGCSGPRLAPEEARFFQACDPLGFILFARNVETPDQLRGLITDLRSSVGRGDAPVLIDQEGGRVARLRPPHWREAPAAARFAALHRHDPHAAREAVWLNAYLIGTELAALGITVDCAPVLDVPQADADPVIGDRAYGGDPATVADLGREVCAGLLAAGVTPVIKHIPGHGRANVDSHHKLPVVDAAEDDLRRIDLRPFRDLARGEYGSAAWAMTAHVVYTAWDEAAPATTSGRVIEAVIRREIGFGGVLISDDLSMQALSGGLGERAAAVMAAGCDLALHCNGQMDEMEAVAARATPLTETAAKRLAVAEARRRQSILSIDPARAATKVEDLLKRIPS